MLLRMFMTVGHSSTCLQFQHSGLSLEGQKFEVSLNYVAKPCLRFPLTPKFIKDTSGPLIFLFVPLFEIEFQYTFLAGLKLII